MELQGLSGVQEMNMENEKQKFKRGNLVRILFGHPMWGGSNAGWENHVDVMPWQVGQLAIIEGSYDDLYNFLTPNVKKGNCEDYAIVRFGDGGKEAWKHESQLELLEEGGAHLFEIATNDQFKEYKQAILDKYKK